MDNLLAQMIGPQASDTGLAKRMRFHQGWWRAFVLCVDPGPHPTEEGESICSTIHHGEETGYNFLSPRVLKAVRETLEERATRAEGLIQENRLFNNLLSSQPLCFNFFGEMRSDPSYALALIGGLFPGVTKVRNTFFEFAPEANYTADNSAFDVAFEVDMDGRQGLIGMECKYTDAFSPKEYDKPEYRSIYERSKAFTAQYEELIGARFNQLFRNQLMSESLVLNGDYDFSLSALFCHPEDEVALGIARQYQSYLTDGENRFRIITYWDFIECAQKINATRTQREFAMMLWARYLGVQLSDRALGIAS